MSTPYLDLTTEQSAQLPRAGRSRPKNPRLYAARALACYVLNKHGTWSTPGLALMLNYRSHTPILKLIADLERGRYDSLMPDGKTGVRVAREIAGVLAPVERPRPEVAPAGGAQAPAFMAAMAGVAIT